MINLLSFFLLVTYSTESTALCSIGPLQINSYFSILNEQMEQLYIFTNGISINSNKTWFKFFDVKNIIKCNITYENLTNNLSEFNLLSEYVYKLNTKYFHFEPNFAFKIIYHAYSDNFCVSNNIYQITLVSDKKSSFILAEYFNSSFNYNFKIGIYSAFFTKFVRTNHSYLISNSNIDINGKWLFLVSEKNQSTQLNCNFFYIFAFFLFLFFKID